jgi:hypothetical protein
MFPEIQPVIVNIKSKQGLTLKSGDIVNVSIIKHLSGNKWAVGIRGKVFPAYSEFELTPGKTIKAEVMSSGNKIVLKIKNDESNRIVELIKQQSLPDDVLSKVIIMSLLKSRLILNNDTIAKMRQFLQKKKESSGRLARILALLVDKEIDISASEIDALVDVMRYGEQGERKQNRNRQRFNKNADDIKGEIEKQVKREEQEGNMLQLFNHLKGKNQNWIIIPYKVKEGDGELSGTIRVLYDPYGRCVKKCVCIVNEEDNTRWSFFITPENSKKRMIIYISNKNKLKRCEKKIEELRIKVHNMGVEIDDIIYNDKEFDGFTPDADIALYKKINTIT